MQGWITTNEGSAWFDSKDFACKTFAGIRRMLDSGLLNDGDQPVQLEIGDTVIDTLYISEDSIRVLNKSFFGN